MAVNATAIWRVRCAGQSGGAGSNTNGGGYDPGIAGAGTDYSQQSTAQLTHVDGVGNGTTTFTSVLGNFTAAMVANATYISGGTLTTGWYFIITYNSATSVVLDRSPGTGTGGTYAVGGAWADPFANITSSGPLVPGNIVYIGGAGTDNPGSADYTTTSYRTPTNGDTTNGYVKFIGENGRPRIHSDGLIYYNSQRNWFENLYFGTGVVAQNADYGLIGSDATGLIIAFVNCVFDQCGKDIAGFRHASGIAVACELFSSTANSGSAGTYPLIRMNSEYGHGIRIDGCNIHDAWGDGINIVGLMHTITNSIIAKCTGNGLTISTYNTQYEFRSHIVGNTIDGNKGHGINVSDAAALLVFDCYSNLITNHNQASKYGINVTAGTTAVNDRIKSVWDFNWFYNNTANFNAISAGPHDNTAGTDPLYTNQTTQDYTLQSTSPVIAKGFPAGATYSLPGVSPASLSTISPLVPRRKVSPDVESYMDAGGVQRVMAAGGGGGMLVHPGMSGGARG